MPCPRGDTGKSHLSSAPFGRVRLKSLSDFAKEYGNAFHRIEALSKVDSVMRVLDMKREDVREAVLYRECEAVELYRSELGVDYEPGE